MSRTPGMVMPSKMGGLQWIGGVIMAQVIEFYIPARFKPKVKWVPPEQRGKILAFPTDLKKSA
ncbi:MAG: hypothetical protein LAO18_18070 [Acidobacteriia bacterium]|nr:hypothetical protein [Terriglobia bacterium]